ncbi:MAG TPA: neutral/alkaline non-lysosomal ceramidase N-terminal domain-containing protein [Actinomycetota bacterium]|nr:neutral/alkaline non-lysosomal ceramidase N-terminal domain-containing protein [Actinomycetota bacterium]
MLRRLGTSLIAVATVIAGFTAHASAAPKLLADGTWARAAYAAVEPPPGVLRAGAASGDITPPPGSPMTGFYVIRHCATMTAVEPALRAEDKQRQIQEDPTEAPYATQCTAARLGPDTDGYAKTFPASEGNFGRLRAQAFVLNDGARKVAIVSVDLPGFFGEMHEAVARRIAKLGIARDGLLVSASHTHTGPGGYFQQNLAWAALGGDVLDPRIFEAITSGIVAAITTADARLQPAKIAAGEAQITGNGNRRSSQWELNPEAKLGIDPKNSPRLGMLRIDTTDGTPIGVITNFATHGVIGGESTMWMTGDDKAWVGRLVERGIREESNLAADVPVVDATLNGAQGDIGSGSCLRNWPNMNRSSFSDLACMESAGIRQASQYLDLWRSLEGNLSNTITLDARADMVCFCGQEVADDPYDPFDRGEYVPANDDPKYFNVGNVAIQGEGKAPTTLFPGHHRRTPLLVGAPGLSPKNVRIQVLRVGDTAFASMPGEPTRQMGARVERSVKAALAGLAERVWVAGLSNDHNAYFATIQEYEAYQYEGGWSFYGQQTGNLLKLRLVELATSMAQGKPVPACTIARDCIENPDTTALSIAPASLAPDVPAEIVAQPADVERFQGTGFTWYGGGPSIEWRPGSARARLQRSIGDEWVDVATDMDPEIPVRYGKRYGRHRFTALLDPTADHPVGTYRFVVAGRYAGPTGAPVPYALTSRSFEVRPSTGLHFVTSQDATVGVGYPAPDRLRNFRWRPTSPLSWTVTGELNGDEFQATGPFTLSGGDTLVVSPGGIVDEHGNTNGAPLTIIG